MITDAIEKRNVIWETSTKETQALPAVSTVRNIDVASALAAQIPVMWMIIIKGKHFSRDHNVWLQ